MTSSTAYSIMYGATVCIHSPRAARHLLHDALTDARNAGWHKECVRVKAAKQRTALQLCTVADTNTAMARHLWSKWRAQTRLESSTSRKRAVLQHLLSKSSAQRLQRAWRVWHTDTTASQYSNKLLQQALLRRRQQQLWSCLSAIRQHSTQRSKLRSTLRRLISATTAPMLRRGMAAFRWQVQLMLAVNARSGRRRNFFNTAATVNAADSSNTTASTAAVASSAQHRRQQQQQQQQLSQTEPAAVTRSGRYASDRYYSSSSTAAQLVKPAAMHDSAYDEQFSDAYGEEYSALQQVLAQRGRACAHRLRTHYCSAALRGNLRGWRHVALLQRHCRQLAAALARGRQKRHLIAILQAWRQFAVWSRTTKSTAIQGNACKIEYKFSLLKRCLQMLRTLAVADRCEPSDTFDCEFDRCTLQETAASLENMVRAVYQDTATASTAQALRAVTSAVMARHQLKLMKLVCLKLWLARISATAATATPTAAAAAATTTVAGAAGGATRGRQYQHQSTGAQHSAAAVSLANTVTAAASAVVVPGTIVLQLETVRRAAVTACQALASVTSIGQLFISAAATVETALSTGNYTALLMLHDHTSNQLWTLVPGGRRASFGTTIGITGLAFTSGE
eukprot:17782-Heterococcus_DN1.PRE.1